ncbi:MAG TPA: MmcQ/YjbR family DNA-binding protein [Candidatus Angelobacter sp.]|nr:MmcQ/YjbR family DNA-binding protein [Candidatus Angelobacter sp.]
MPTYIDWAREVCLALPHATEDVKWEHNLLFRIGGKMFCVANLEPAISPTRIAFKCTPERFAELVEIEGIIPAPYMAHNKWVAVLELGALRQAELKELIQASYQLVLQKLPRKMQASLAEKPIAKRPKTKPPRAAKRKK